MQPALPKNAVADGHVDPLLAPEPMGVGVVKVHRLDSQQKVLTCVGVPGWCIGLVVRRLSALSV